MVPSLKCTWLHRPHRRPLRPLRPLHLPVEEEEARFASEEEQQRQRQQLLLVLVLVLVLVLAILGFRRIMLLPPQVPSGPSGFPLGRAAFLLADSRSALRRLQRQRQFLAVDFPSPGGGATS